MDESHLQNLFDLSGKSIAITGGGGVLGAAIGQGLSLVGAKISILDLNPEAARKVADEIQSTGGEALAVPCDVLDKVSIEAAAEAVIRRFKQVDILINAAGGNKAQATTSDDLAFFDLPVEAVQWVFDLNFIGTLLPSQVFGKYMASQEQGVILNISSMNAFRPLTRIPAYSAAKAAVSNFTQWLAVYLAQEISPHIRVNALAPGFFCTEQNRFLLYDAASGSLTSRGEKILEHTPLGRFGDPEDLLGTVLWLLSPASSFVTGVVVPIDGGFSAFSGV